MVVSLKSKWRVEGITLARRRLAVAAALALALFSVANYFGQWVGPKRWLGAFIAVSFVILWVVMTFIGPTISEIEENRRASNGS